MAASREVRGVSRSADLALHEPAVGVDQLHHLRCCHELILVAFPVRYLRPVGLRFMV